MRLEIVTSVAVFGVLLACAGLPSSGVASSGESAPQTAKPRYQEGKDYKVLNRVRLMDQHGFSQPVEAFSLLVPSGWTAEGGITWQQTSCMADAVELRATLKSPDGAYQVDFYPGRSWEFNSDPYMQQLVAASGGVSGSGCRFMAPMGVEAYIRQHLVPFALPSYQVTKVERNAEVERALEAQLAPMVQATGMSIQVEAGGAYAEIPGQKTAIVLALIQRMQSPLPAIQGGMALYTGSAAALQVVATGPAGHTEELEKVAGTILGSLRSNPEWESAVQRIRDKISADARAGIAERSRINFETSREISDMNMRSWERRTASQDRGMEQFSQAIRGVESWKELDGAVVELGHGYQNAWRRVDGSYLVSENPDFDPNRALQERWEPLTRAAR